MDGRSSYGSLSSCQLLNRASTSTSLRSSCKTWVSQMGADSKLFVVNLSTSGHIIFGLQLEPGTEDFWFDSVEPPASTPLTCWVSSMAVKRSPIAQWWLLAHVDHALCSLAVLRASRPTILAAGLSLNTGFGCLLLFSRCRVPGAATLPSTYPTLNLLPRFSFVSRLVGASGPEY